MLDLNQNIADLVLEHSECARIFQRHRIDFCCRGERSVESACAERGIAPEVLAEELSRAIIEREGTTSPDPRQLPTEALVAHIVSKHHEYLRWALPFVKDLARKVSRVHGDRKANLRQLDLIVSQLCESLLPHIDDEERTLFPTLLAGDRDDEQVAAAMVGMQREHLLVGQLLDSMRTAAEEFEPPEWACNSYRTLMSELLQLEGDILTHVHLENHVLAPRFAVA